MNPVYLREYGVAATIDFALYELDGVDLKVDAAHAAGDTKIMKDEGAEANTANAFVDEGQGYSLALSATEMEAARIVVYVVDQTDPKVWLDKVLLVETYGHASAQHEEFPADAVKVGSSKPTADNLVSMYTGVCTFGAVNDGSATTTDFDTDLTEASDDHYNNEILAFIDGVLKGQYRKITNYTGSSKNVEVLAFTEAPGNGDKFVILGLQ
jgi:hypothetical protein